jgi:hypothetical protein
MYRTNNKSLLVLLGNSKIKQDIQLFPPPRPPSPHPVSCSAATHRNSGSWVAALLTSAPPWGWKEEGISILSEASGPTAGSHLRPKPPPGGARERGLCPASLCQPEVNQILRKLPFPASLFRSLPPDPFKSFSLHHAWFQGKASYFNKAEYCKNMADRDAYAPGVTKRCRLSWLTNSVLVCEPKCGGWRGLS